MKKEKEYKTKYGTVSLPLPLINLIKKNIQGTGMQSVSAYVTFILRQILSSPPKQGDILGKKQEEEIKQRLKHLGYL